MFQVAWGYGLFTGGLGAHGGCETLGACAIPASSGNTARQLQLLCDLPVIGIGCTPSYGLVLAERLRAEKRRPKALKYAICGAESWTREMREELEELFGVDRDQHLRPHRDHRPGRRAGVPREARAARAGRPLPGRDRRPRVAARRSPTASAASWCSRRSRAKRCRCCATARATSRRWCASACACGRTTARIDWFTGRVDDMLVIRGVNVFPSAVEEVLLRFPELSPNYRIFVDRPAERARPDAGRGGTPSGRGDRRRAASRSAVTARLAETLLVSLQTRVVPPGTIERIEAGKAKRVIDRRTV